MKKKSNPFTIDGSSKDVIIFNVRSKSDSLRNDKCKNNLFHIPPSYSMLSDALTQYLLKKSGINGFWLLDQIQMIKPMRML